MPAVSAGVCGTCGQAAPKKKDYEPPFIFKSPTARNWRRTARGMNRALAPGARQIGKGTMSYEHFDTWMRPRFFRILQRAIELGWVTEYEERF